MKKIKRFRVLSLDGGGIRGAFAAAFLAELEQQLDAPIRRYWNLIAGTSTGGIIALAASFDEPMARVVDFYRDHGPGIFARRSPKRLGWKGRLMRACSQRWLSGLGVRADDLFQTRYDHQPLRTALDNVLGSRTLLDAKTRVLIPAVDLSKGAPVVFKTPHLADANSRDRQFSAVDIALATASAPTYFPHTTMGTGSAYTDGGLWANNPVLVSMAEANRLLGNIVGVEVLSIGTGKGRYSVVPPEADAGIAWWGPRLIEVMSRSQSDGSMRVAEFMLGSRCSRVDFDLPDSSWQLDSVEYVDRLIHFGREAAHQRLASLGSSILDEPVDEILNWQGAMHSIPSIAAQQ